MSILSRLAVKGAKEKVAKKAAERAASTVTGTSSLVVPVKRRAPTPTQRKALPAPPKVLALPAPGPGLPPLVSKPRGGQFWADKKIADANVSPEEAAREGALGLGVATMRWEPEDYGVLRNHDAFIDAISSKTPEQQWLERALAKYYKTEFGAPDDPLRSLAERGLHYDPDMTPERWKDTVNSYLLEDPIGSVLLPSNPQGGMPGAGSDLRGEAVTAMPWLAKLPVTDKMYGISRGGLDLSHFTDEFYNALNAEASGLPADLAVRPEMLERMSFPQAVERVGRINQFRAKEMERAALAAMDNPVTQVFKEYPEDNPMGLRWVEMAPPKGDGPANYDVEEELRKALKYEGDAMGHCVGGYCPDVMSGRSRIFSLRDAKGEPHVTIETKPGDPTNAYRAELARMRESGELDAWMNWLRQQAADPNYTPGMNGLETLNKWRAQANLPPLETSVPDDILQIKGKQNRAPKDDYLPFVQDFVKSQKWSNVGDLGNTGLVRLPDGRYITQQQYDGVVSSEGLHDLYQSYDFSARGFPADPSRLSPEDWEQFSRHFEGFAIGGRVDADRCFCRHPLSVKGKK